MDEKQPEIYRSAREGEYVGEGISIHSNGDEEHYFYVIKNGKRTKTTDLPQMKRKPENKQSTPPELEIPEYSEMSEIEAAAERRARFLMSPFNIQEAARRKSRYKFTFYLLLAIAMIITIIWAVTR